MKAEETVTRKKIKVALFGHYTPIYRKGVLEKLSRMEDIELTVSSSADFPAGLRMIRPDEVSFPLRDIRTCLIRIPFTKKRLAWQPAMVAALLSGSHDVYILPNTLSYLDVWCCLILSRLLGRRVCLWGHGRGSLNGRAATRIRKLFMGLADALVFYTDAARDAWRAAGLPAERMFVAYNALDTEESAGIRSRIGEGELAEFLRARGLAGKKLVLFVGRLQERKRPDLLVEAMAQVVGRVPEAHALLIGDGPMRETVERRVAELALERQVTLAGALFDEEILARYLMAATAGVMPSHAGLFVQHAFDYGLPIVVGDNLATHAPEVELVREAEGGLFFRDGDAGALARCLTGFLLDDKSRLAMSRNAQRIIRERYNVDTMALGLARAVRYAARSNDQKGR